MMKKTTFWAGFLPAAVLWAALSTDLSAQQVSASARVSETALFEREWPKVDTDRNVYFESEGTAHEWLTWRRCLRELAPLLFR